MRFFKRGYEALDLLRDLECASENDGVVKAPVFAAREDDVGRNWFLFETARV